MIRLPRARRATLATAGILLCGLTVVGCSNSNPQPGETSPSSANTSSASSSAQPSSSSSGTPTSSATASETPSSNVQSTVNALIPGFPKTLLPLLPGATVKLSAVDKSTTPATASLVGSTTSSSSAIVDFYTKAFKAQGFTALPGGNVGAVVSKDFVRQNGQESVNLSISSEGGSSTFTLGASVAVASLK
ncbi:hypothetical protein [Psychromicrobium lacuslunae]|uniref:Lipoprotein n=1 Tax=Psychromicrobium lacuslunae TaxID=1618207 RepID=A0A0D4BWL3_9MICC|nr:hypothetical protein [Psychromicrobium lacuslunae]AJT40709.1 hypothetical protein UM93_02805 [Psychromicrobium lacuslunae]